MRRLLSEEVERSLDDAADDIIRQAAPEIVKAIREREVDEDVEDFYQGAIQAVEDLESYMDYRYPHEEKFTEYDPSHQELYDAGYAYGEANFQKIHRGIQDIVDTKTYRQQIEQAIKKFEGRITEEAVIAALEEIYEFGKNQMHDVHGLIKKAQEKWGWKAYAGIACIEIMEHFVIPGVLMTINPAFGILTTIPTVEILAAIGLTAYKMTKEPEPEEPHVPGHLDWYEEQGLQVAGFKRRGLRLTESQLRSLIRKRILAGNY